MSLRNRRKKIDEAIQLNHGPEDLYKKRPGLSDKKQVELFTKYCPIVHQDYRDELCLYPGETVMENVLKMKKERKRSRAEDKAGRNKKKKQRKWKEKKRVRQKRQRTRK